MCVYCVCVCERWLHVSAPGEYHVQGRVLAHMRTHTQTQNSAPYRFLMRSTRTRGSDRINSRHCTKSFQLSKAMQHLLCMHVCIRNCTRVCARALSVSLHTHTRDRHCRPIQHLCVRVCARVRPGLRACVCARLENRAGGRQCPRGSALVLCERIKTLLRWQNSHTTHRPTTLLTQQDRRTRWQRPCGGCCVCTVCVCVCVCTVWTLRYRQTSSTRVGSPL